MTGPIDDPRRLRPDVAAELFDEETRERLARLAGALRFSAVDVIREGTLRYMAELEAPAAEADRQVLADGPDAGEQLK